MGPLAQGFLEGAERRGHDPSRLLSFKDATAAAAAAPSIVRAGDAVLVKASRGIRAEAVVDALVERFGVA
jgi:UDP-N-acetylmuramoyl-tripeptide--D-alanyl-D-alanine ligase